jgi:hypothetical protein
MAPEAIAPARPDLPDNASPGGSPGTPAGLAHDLDGLPALAPEAVPPTDAIRSAFRRVVRRARPDLNRMSGIELTALMAARDLLLHAASTNNPKAREAPPPLPGPYSTSPPRPRSVDVYL